MNFPLKLKFKYLTVVPQIYIEDASGQQCLYLRQKLFKLKEQATIYSDVNKTRTLYNLNADRIIDFSPKYHITTPEGASVCDIKRNGMRSLWKADYKISSSEQVLFSINEENPWTKFFNELFLQIPLVGLLTGFIFNPSYLVTRASDNSGAAPVMRIKKEPSFVEGRFAIEKIGDLSEVEEQQVVVGSLLTVLLERTRG